MNYLLISVILLSVAAEVTNLININIRYVMQNYKETVDYLMEKYFTRLGVMFILNLIYCAVTLIGTFYRNKFAVSVLLIVIISYIWRKCPRWWMILDSIICLIFLVSWLVSYVL